MLEPADSAVICQVAVLVAPLCSVPTFAVGELTLKRPFEELNVNETLVSCVLVPVFAVF